MQRHDMDVVSLAFAAIFITIGAIFLTGTIDAGEFVSVWALPAGLLATGLVLGGVALARYRRHSEEHDSTTDL